MARNLSAAILSLVAKGKAGIPNPTIADVLAVAPHLEREEAATLLQMPDTNVDFIGPPLLIRGAEHVYSLQRHRRAPTRTLNWIGSYRRRESFLHDTPPREWKPIEYDYRERVANYAELTYGDELYWDESRFILEHRLYYPDEMVVTVTAGYGRSWDEINQLSAGRCPVLQTMDDQLKVVAASTLPAHELRGGRLPMASSNCGLCGGPVFKECKSCGQPYPKADVNWNVPLHLGLLEAAGMLDNWVGGDPIDAIKVHYAKWAAEGASRRLATPTRDRVITFRDDNQ